MTCLNFPTRLLDIAIRPNYLNEQANWSDDKGDLYEYKT